MTAEVAAIIPTHDRAALLSTTLRSVLWQRDVELEAVVVDDGSSDGTSEVVDRLGDPRVRLVRNETPQGVSAARNRGAALARARWLAFCDDDDLWAPDKLARQVAAAEASGRRWAYGGAVHVSIDLRVTSAQLPPSPDRLVARLPSWNLMPGGSSNVIVRADAFESRGGWDDGLVNLADWDLWARLAQDGLPAEVRAPLIGYRIHDGNASGDVGLILREAKMIDGRYRARLDVGELHHYLAWVYLRRGHRRPAVRHLATAALRGQGRAVAQSVTGLARRRLGKLVPAVRPRSKPGHDEWVAEAETWIASLREAADAAWPVPGTDR
jgi:glycosyltransferase involved in cell wall biosynthesis